MKTPAMLREEYLLKRVKGFKTETLLNVSTKKVAIGFWGINRSLKYTIESIQTNILSQLTEHNIEYSIYVHTYSMNRDIKNKRAKEHGVFISESDYELLKPDYIQVDDEDVIKKQIDFVNYRTYYDWYNTDYKNIDNFIWAMYSKQQLCKMIIDSGMVFDAVLICRPDVRYHNPFNIAYFNIINSLSNTICIPNFHVYKNKINDRFFLFKPTELVPFGDLFNELLTFSKSFPIHPEQFIYEYLVNRYKYSLVYIPFHFSRVRSNGEMLYDLSDVTTNHKEYTTVVSHLPFDINMLELTHLHIQSPIIWVTVINFGYVDYTKNFLRSMEVNNCPFTVIVYCTDTDTINALSGWKCICIHISLLGLDKNIPNTLCTYTTKEYTELVYMKVDIIRLTLKLSKKPVGYIDTDIVLMADPTIVILNAMKQYPEYGIFSQCNEKSLCTNIKCCPKLNSGVIVYRNTPTNISLLEYTPKDMVQYKATQAFLIKKFDDLKIKRMTIDTDIFLNGSYPGLQNGTPITMPSTAVLVHYNWLVDDNYKKRDLMKEQLQWYLEPHNINIRELLSLDTITKKVAIGFWGFNRSLTHTIDSIKKNILSVLTTNNIEYSIFIHSFNELEDFGLNASIQVDDEDIIKKKIDLKRYRTCYDWYNTDYKNIDNFLLGMYSKQRLCKMIADSGKGFDAVMICRPDVIYHNPFNLAYFNIIDRVYDSMCIPNFHVYNNKINDRFFLFKPKELVKFGNLFNELVTFSKRFPIHPEQFLYEHLVNRGKFILVYIPLHFSRVFSDGTMCYDIKDVKTNKEAYTKVVPKLPIICNLSKITEEYISSPIIWITFINIDDIEATKKFLLSISNAFTPIIYYINNDVVHALTGLNCICLHTSLIGINILKESIKFDVIHNTLKLSHKPVGYIDINILIADPTRIMYDAITQYPDYDIFSQCKESCIDCTHINYGCIVYNNNPTIISLLDTINNLNDNYIKRMTIHTNIFITDTIEITPSMRHSIYNDRI